MTAERLPVFLENSEPIIGQKHKLKTILKRTVIQTYDFAK